MNRDGTIYRLRGPNPLLEKQSEWDKRYVKLINLGKRPSIIEDKDNPIKKQESNVVNITNELNLKKNTKSVSAQEFINEVKVKPKSEPEPEPAPVPQPIDKPKEEAVEIQVDRKLERIMRERGVEFYCAPAIGTKQHADDLYGESYNTTIYGDQFIFDAIVVDESDFQIQFWCIKEISIDSIVLKKVIRGGERWWRVSEVGEKTGGYLVNCVISNSNPDFTL